MVLSEQDRLASSDSTVMTSNMSSTRGPCALQVVSSSLPLNDASKSLSLSSFWTTYKSFVRKHHIKLELADGAIHRLLFWLPHHDNSGDGPPWREVLYGLLSVNQLAMHCSQQQNMENSHGFSLRTRKEPNIPATSLRIALNVVHCLMPSLLELVVAKKEGSDTNTRNKRQAQLRLRLEQLKFVLRLYLLYSYWNQYLEESSSSSSSPSLECQQLEHSKKIKRMISPGIMLDGGMYQPHMDDPLGISERELLSSQRRRNYRGRRTGLAISKEVSSRSQARLMTPQSQSTPKQILLGEFLYSLRPVWWAAAEARQAASSPGSSSSASAFQSWIVTLGMELVSLGLLSGERHSGNPYSKEEWNRRRMKLLLYLLRAPVWNRVTSPTLERSSAVARRVPLVGGLFDSYIWDWILYWKHPYVSEEG